MSTYLPFRWFFSLFLGLRLSLTAAAQAPISGLVRDSLTQAPVPFASVFLANTARGTTTDENGRFTLLNVPAGNYELVASSIGYRLSRQPIQVGSTPLSAELRPAPVSNQLAGVTIRPRPNKPDDYQRFTELFLGQTAFARQCRIRNPDGVRVDYDIDTNTLTADAPDYLQVDNEALGYRIRFYGLHFSLDFKKGMLTYYSWPVFEDLPTRSKARQRRWAANRLTAYQGSMPHFLRCVRAGTLAAEGFVVNRLRRVPNPRWGRADSVLNAQREAHRNQIWRPSDSLLRVHNEPPMYAYLHQRPLPADSLRRISADAKQVFLHFRDLAQVTYKREKPDPSYTLPARIGETPVHPTEQTSVLHLIQPAEAAITSTGQLLNPLAAYVEGYWSAEKVGELLPVDYEPAVVPPSGAPTRSAQRRKQ
jgi:hypothetical protein